METILTEIIEQVDEWIDEIGDIDPMDTFNAGRLDAFVKVKRELEVYR